MKSRPRPFRLGSFEQLESRAMLAHGGMNFAELSFNAVSFGAENLGPMRFVDQGPGQYYSAREFQHEPPSVQAGGMEQRGGMRMENERNFEPHNQFADFDGDMGSEYAKAIATPVAIVIPVTSVIVFINIPAPAASQPQYSAPLVSNLMSNSANSSPASSAGGISYTPSSNTGRSSSLVAPTGSYGNSLLSVNAPPRSTPVLRNGLDSLSIVTSLTLKRADSDNRAADETEVAHTDGDNETTSHDSRERETTVTLPMKDPAAAMQKESSGDDSELIELTAEDPLTRGKRKVARKPALQSDSAAMVNSALRLERQVDRSQLPHAEIWLQAAPKDADFSPVADDLIELLANESSEVAKPTTHANSFEAHATIPIEATVGYFRAAETETEQNSPEHAQPAAIAAAALPVPAGK